jgi:hypothetical protein
MRLATPLFAGCALVLVTGCAAQRDKDVVVTAQSAQAETKAANDASQASAQEAVTSTTPLPPPPPPPPSPADLSPRAEGVRAAPG